MRLSEVVAFDQPMAVSDGQGGQSEGWTENVHACKASFLYLRGGEAALQGRLEGKQPVVVTIRLNASSEAIEPHWRMRDTVRGDIYNIRSIVPTDDRHWLEMTCERGVAV